MAKKSNEPKTGTPFKTVVQNLVFHNFEEKKIFTGLYKDTVTIGDEEDKTFTANIFVDLATGEEVYLSNNYSIEKAIKSAKQEYKDSGNGIRNIVFQVEFIAKTMVKGKPFNQYKIGYCTEEEYNSFVG